MEIDIVKLNNLWRFASDAEQNLITMAEQLRYIKEKIQEMRRVELAMLEAKGISPPGMELEEMA